MYSPQWFSRHLFPCLELTHLITPSCIFNNGILLLVQRWVSCLKFLKFLVWFFKLIYLLLLLASLGLPCWTWAFSPCDKWGLLFLAVCRLLIEVASLVGDAQAWTSAVAAFQLTCSQPRGNLLHQWSNLCPLPWQADSHPLYHQGNPLAECILTPNLIWPLPISQAKSCVVSTVPLQAQTHSIEFLGEVTLSSVDLYHTECFHFLGWLPATRTSGLISKKTSGAAQSPPLRLG